MKKYYLLTVVIFLTVTISCNNRQEKKDELRTVINHYSKNPRDSLKLKAAKFLIRDLTDLKTLDTTTLTRNKIYFTMMNSLYRHRNNVGRLTASELSKTIDSLNKELQLTPYYPSVHYIDEKKIITADFLINNIEKAFYVWQNMPWAKSVSFADFCEYILPYRCIDTYSSNSRIYFLKKYKTAIDSSKGLNDSFKLSNFIVNDINTWFSETPDIISKYPYLTPISFSNLLKGRFGNNEDAVALKITALRSVGIPAIMDEIPNWGNDNGTDYINKIIGLKHDLATHDRTVPKVYRHFFSKQATSLAAVASPKADIPLYFRNPRLKDVTSEYVQTTDVALDVRPVPGQKYAYLCVFDNQNWIPVAWASVNSNRATFKMMGKNIVYLPIYYSNNDCFPAGLPFLLNKKGKIEEIESDTQKITITINGVIKGDIYKLYYWNNNWIPMTLKRPAKNSVTFDGVPKNALLMVKDLNSGVQERIFTYKNERQLFW